jgi:hypothetical protein
MAEPTTTTLWDEFLAWLRGVFGSDSPPGSDSNPPGAPPSSPPATTLSGLASSQASNCDSLITLVRHYGPRGGSALWELAIQQTIMASGTAAGLSGGFIGAAVGAVVGGVTGAASAAAAQAKCKADHQAEFDAAAAQWKLSHDAMKAEFAACKSACATTYPHHGWGPAGKPYRDCMKACRERHKAERRALHHAHAGDLGGAGYEELVAP